MKTTIQWLIKFAACALFMLAFIALSAWCISPKAEAGQKYNVNSSNGGGAGTVEIIEVDGYKFAVLIGYAKGAICQVDESKRKP